MTDDYPTCAETYVTLRIYHDASDPALVTQTLDLEPTDFQVVGSTYEHRGKTRTYQISGWFLCSKKFVESYDSAKHLDWLLARIEPSQPAIKELRAQGWRLDIACLWDSDFGHGGPTLSPVLLQRLAAAGVELSFDVYFRGAYVQIRNQKKITSQGPGEKP
jgi:hypothetical protein